MTKLATLRSQLTGLRQARAAVRAATAWSSLVTAALWALAGVFLLDFLFELQLAPRLVVMLLAAAAVAWAFVRYTRPLMGHAESEIDMALLVERQQQIDSDLVAALQFEAPEAARWGSPQLETAVIDYVAAVGRGINVFEGFSREQMTRRGLVLAITTVSLLALAGLFPGHAAAFFNRLCCGSMHYPTRTRIAQIVVNDRPVLVAAEHGSQPVSLKSAQGRPVTFLVAAGGSLPPKGAIRLQSLGAIRSKTSIDLAPLTESEAQQQWPNGTSFPRGAVYAGELPRLMESVSYQVFLGDAWTDAATIDMVPLPTVETRLTPLAPRYARASGDAFDPASRQVSVLEGTSIKLAVQGTNHKPLKAVWMDVTLPGAKPDKPQRFDLVKADAAGLAWALPEKGSPLTNIRSETRYEIQASDLDGLSLDSPIRGSIRIRPDRPPSGSAEVVHKVVLPTAEPVIEYRAADDYGLSKIVLVAEIERFAPASATGPTIDLGQGVVASAEEIPVEIHRFDLLATEPILGDRLPVANRYGLSLSPLKLAKGDRVKLTLEVTDYRGENEAGLAVGQSHVSDALVLEISDESGVLAAISQADERSEQRLTDIIKRQLGIGETP
jgi:hypothetical protein